MKGPEIREAVLNLNIGESLEVDHRTSKNIQAQAFLLRKFGAKIWLRVKRKDTVYKVTRIDGWFREDAKKSA